MSAQAARGGRTVAKRAAAGARRPAAVAPMSFAKREAAPAEDRVPLFEIDGVVYDMPATISTGEALQHLVMVNAQATEAMRGMYLLRNVVGSDAFDALLGSADMQPGDWHKLMRILSDHVFGQLEAPGN